MAKQTCIITITDGISPTSMPFNEFVLYRFQNYPEEKQIIIQVFEKSVDRNITIPRGVEFYSLGMNPWALLKKIFFLEQKYDVKAYHIHEGKSVILFSVASFFLLPEGGFEEEEVQKIEASGGVRATLGKRILRTQTAPVAALAAIMLLTENLE